MKKLVLPAFLLAGILAGCNASLVEATAPEIVSTDWVLPESVGQPKLEGTWRLYAFFSPT